MNFHVSFGQGLQQRRKALGLTQKDLAQGVGCSVSAIRKIEADERRPSRQIAELLAERLGIPSEERSAFVGAARGEAFPSDPAAPARRMSSPPSPLTPLIGRQHELAQINRLLQDRQCRLLTLTGLGGIGKTRLAIEVASAQREAFADGVCFVSLEGVSAAEFMAPAIADALGLAGYGAADLKMQLFDHLRDKGLLLVLDGLEHLLAGSELLAELLLCAPEVKLLITSRERLNLYGEWVFDVQGLPLPPADQREGLEAYSAVALFLQSARRLAPDFALETCNQADVVRICQLVDGVPLGIELAAAWVRTLSCSEIAQEIERNLDFLTTSARDVAQRHRSLRAAFDHSWNLLSAEEQEVMRQLSVFRGGFQRETAEQVAGAPLPLLSALVDKSLLRRDPAGGYIQHELIRQFAAAKVGRLVDW